MIINPKKPNLIKRLLKRLVLAVRTVDRELVKLGEKLYKIFKTIDNGIIFLGEILFGGFKQSDKSLISLGERLYLAWFKVTGAVDILDDYLCRILKYNWHRLAVRSLSSAMILTMVIIQVLNLTAFEAHIINVTAEPVNDIPMVDPAGGAFCDIDPVIAALSTTFAGAEIYYTLDGSDPECYTHGELYLGPFAILASGFLKARSCHDDKQSTINTWVFDISSEHCPDDKRLIINKVYYDVDDEHGREDKNEWIELYNPTDADINLKKWELCDSDSCGVINPEVIIKAHGYALVSHDNSTWKYWEIPDGVPTIHQLGGPFFLMDNAAEMLLLKHPDGQVVDQLNWGRVDMTWPNLNGSVWMPEGIHVVPGDRMVGRVPDGYDTDAASDWKVLKPPLVNLTYPEGGEVWYVGHTYEITWTAANMNGPDSALAIDLLYSRNSGHTWAKFTSSTTNDGSFEWTVPLFINGYFVPSKKARIKIKASGPENFMVYAEDESDDFCPPIDLSLITLDEIEMLIQLGVIDENYDPNAIIDPEDILNFASTTDEQVETSENSEGSGSSAADQTENSANTSPAVSTASTSPDIPEDTASASSTDETASSTNESTDNETTSTTNETAEQNEENVAGVSEPDNSINSAQTGETVTIGIQIGLNINKMFEDYTESSSDDADTPEDPDTVLKEPDPAIEPADVPSEEKNDGME